MVKPEDIDFVVLVRVADGEPDLIVDGSRIGACVFCGEPVWIAPATVRIFGWPVKKATCVHCAYTKLTAE